MTQWGLDTLFNPAKRHMDEEKRRLQSTREEIGDSSGGKRIDLESGKVVISRDKDDDASDDAAEDADGSAVKRSGSTESGTARRAAPSVTASPTKPATATKPAKSTKSAKSAGPAGEPTAAQKRAAARRGREPR